MGTHVARTAADEAVDALAALSDARRALRDLESLLDGIIANPEGAVGNAHQARRNASIVGASLRRAESAVRAGGRAQVTAVS